LESFHPQKALAQMSTKTSKTPSIWLRTRALTKTLRSSDARETVMARISKMAVSPFPEIFRKVYELAMEKKQIPYWKRIGSYPQDKREGGSGASWRLLRCTRLSRQEAQRETGLCILGGKP
jgi:hypothetical protein